MIDHLVYSIYVNNEKKSYIKFGSMDDSALSSNLTVISTIDAKNWALNVSDILLEGNGIHQKKNVLYIEPSLPYLYLPESEWQLFSMQIEAKYPNIKCN